MDCDEAGGSKGDLDCIVVSLRHAAEDLVRSHKDRLEFVKLSLSGEAGGRDLDEVSNVVLWRGTAAFVGLLSHRDSALNKLGLDKIPKSVGYYIRSESGGKDNDSSFKLRSKTHAESVRGGVPRSIDQCINSHLNRRDCRQPVKSLL